MSEMLETQHFGYFKTQRRKDTEKNEDSASLRLCVLSISGSSFTWNNDFQLRSNL